MIVLRFAYAAEKLRMTVKIYNDGPDQKSGTMTMAIHEERAIFTMLRFEKTLGVNHHRKTLFRHHPTVAQRRIMNTKNRIVAATTTCVFTLAGVAATGMSATTSSHATEVTRVSVVKTAVAPTTVVITTTGASTSAPSAVHSEQIGSLARRIIAWVISKGSSAIKALSAAIKKGLAAVKNYIRYQLPRDLAAAAISLGLEEVAKFIIQYWPF